MRQLTTIRLFFKRILDNVYFRLLLVVGCTVGTMWFYQSGKWEWFVLSLVGLFVSILLIGNLYRRNARKIAFMFDAIDNSDYAFKYATRGHASDDKLVSESMNRITQILFQAKSEAAQQEKYYELIMDSVSTGIIVLDDNGYIYQTNKEALRLLGLSIFTHVKQLAKVDTGVAQVMQQIQPGEKHQVTFTNERGTVYLSLRVSEMTLQSKHLRIIAINDINRELDEKEIDSWIRLTRVLTHEIMNSVTPITSLSDTLLSMHQGDVNEDIRNGLETISTTGKGLIAFVDSYRKFTRIPTPNPTLFYVGKFLDRMIQLAKHQNNYPMIEVISIVEPDDLIVYADENLITQVVLNLLKNAMQAIGGERSDGKILIRAFSTEEEAVVIEVSNNGPIIPAEEIEHIFIPFFTTKEGGSGVGLSVSRQIMRLSGGSIALKNNAPPFSTTFVLTFP
ncbi:PAS domain S-box-containing protein [Parabacteroides sp. PFB2-10]|uniref:sensor histidine kinase n=1 Tax=Parabacteroides sp. PFB2-10 TaxID=1742405 RepID=UPI002473FD6D|nr:ATP-binding protein [Parabacteroides sp. PFB2-10]MDH6313692.1 PAS domain S-box-containing protein [Parabacteroides sp. PFB2-10]